MFDGNYSSQIKDRLFFVKFIFLFPLKTQQTRTGISAASYKLMETSNVLLNLILDAFLVLTSLEILSSICLSARNVISSGQRTLQKALTQGMKQSIVPAR